MKYLEDSYTSTEYGLVCENVKAEIDVILCKGAVHYVNIFEIDDILASVRAKALSDVGATTVKNVRRVLGTLTQSELILLRGLLV